MIPAKKFNGVAFLPRSIDIFIKRSNMMEEKQIPKYVHNRKYLETKRYYLNFAPSIVARRRKPCV